MSGAKRTSSVSRTTNETRIELHVNLDGGLIDIATGVDFFDHMLVALAKHSRIGLTISATGDGMDHHHVIEDVGIALGKAIHDALGDKRGISRFGDAIIPLDDALILASIDLAGRAYTNVQVTFLREDLGAMPTEMVPEFFRALADNAKLTLHLQQLHGHVAHHVCEATFKAFARAFGDAIAIVGGDVPSTKGVLE
ncbi:MAG: imidazoleglycerol-phosphate dehydratase HisB [Vulcanimicrobiaceae bacterium]